jgi:arginyl-tRNA--protein-N-Asp/Glu arginylyltransferase
MQQDSPVQINEYFYSDDISSDEMDLLLAQGWRNFGQYFFRHSWDFYRETEQVVIPLRIRLADFMLSKKQRRIIKQNQDLHTVIRPIVIDDEKHELFDRHKQRFKSNVPQSLYTFLDFEAATIPCEALEFCIYERDKLLAASFLNFGNTSTSGIYAMFEPTETKRSLGIYTMLLEIEFSRQMSKNYYYQGYAYIGESFYDYKKRFSALEMYDWQGNWTNFSEKLISD